MNTVDEEPVVITADRSELRLVTINRPARRNALNVEVVGRIADEVNRAGADKSVRAVVITGAGEHFSAGGDANSVAQTMDEADPYDTVEFVRCYHRAVEAIWHCPVPVVAAVSGVAYGGAFNLTLACDFVVAHRSARFCQVFMHRDVVPDMGGTFLLPRLIGMQRAKDLIFRTGVLTADDALELGVVCQVTDEDVVAEAVRVAGEACIGSRSAIALAKRMLNASTAGSLTDSMDLEAAVLALTLRSDAAREGFAAFRKAR
jgi:2-(1,2-epoxy-1,2-dihydrophenyl)acetyl-CoA isomerase